MRTIFYIVPKSFELLSRYPQAADAKISVEYTAKIGHNKNTYVEISTGLKFRGLA
jgi:hypothetical protein